MLKVVGGKRHITFRGTTTRIKDDFLAKTMGAENIIKELKEKRANLQFSTQKNYLSKVKAN